MRKFKLNEGLTPNQPNGPNIMSVSSPQAKSPSASLTSSTSSSSLSQATTDLLNKLLSNSDTTNQPNTNGLSSQNIPINWKNVWDYFYQMVEAKLVKELMSTSGKGEAHSATGFYPYSATKPYLTSLAASSSNLALNTIAKQQISCSSSTTNSSTPPFPKLRPSSVKYQHEFEHFIFSSVNSCDLCGATFKSSCQFIGLKCKSCAYSCHEQCLIETNASLPECSVSVDVWPAHGYAHQINVIPSGPHLDTSVYSMQTSSSCSTTPNSNYSHQGPFLSHSNRYTFGNGAKLDTDIGSACGKLRFVFFNF